MGQKRENPEGKKENRMKEVRMKNREQPSKSENEKKEVQNKENNRGTEKSKAAVQDFCEVLSVYMNTLEIL